MAILYSQVRSDARSPVNPPMPWPPAAAVADNTNQKEEQTMFIHEYLMKAIQDDARRPANETGCSARHGGLAGRAASVWFPLLQRGAEPRWERSS